MNLGPIEIVTVAVFALIVFGPRRLPEMARATGKMLGELRRMSQEVTDGFKAGLEEPDEPKSFPPPGPRS